MNSTVRMFALATLSLTLVACGNKDKPKPAKPAAAKAAPAAAGKAGASKGASKAAAKAAAKPAAVAKDISLTLDKNVVAWVSIRSFGALFDAIDTVAGQLKMVPPGMSLRKGALEDLTRLSAANGVKGFGWLDQSRPIHWAVQDDVPGDIMAGVVLLLPTTDTTKAIAAFTQAKRGAEAKGHAALVAMGARTLYLDAVPNYLVVSDRPERFGKIEAFAKRLAAFKPPALVYVGVATSELAKTQQFLVSMVMAQLAKQTNTSGAAQDSLKRWLSELERVDLTVDASRDYVTIGSRLLPKANSELAKQLNRGRGHDASGQAAILPGNSFLTFLSSQDSAVDDSQLKAAIETFVKELDVVEADRAKFNKDMQALSKLQDGNVLFTVFPDGNKAIGVAGAAGSRDPKAFNKVLKRLMVNVLVSLIEAEEKRKAGSKPAAKKKLSPQRQKELKALAALKSHNLQKVIDVFAADLKKQGVTMRLNSNTHEGVACDALDLSFDAKKMPDDPELQTMLAAIGERTSLVACAGAKRSVVAVGTSGLEQARRIAAAKPGGLADAPVFASALKRAPQPPSSFFYLNAGAAARTVSALVGSPLVLPADRALSGGCGYRTRSLSCTLDVPVALIEGAMKIAKQN